MPFNNWPCTQRENLRAVENLEEVLDKDEYPEGGDEKDKTWSVVIS
jgi:hypothetical protein